MKRDTDAERETQTLKGQQVCASATVCCQALRDVERRMGEGDGVLRSVSKTGAAVVQLMRPAVESPARERVVCVRVCARGCVSERDIERR